jgi:hypothetical protein
MKIAESTSKMQGIIVTQSEVDELEESVENEVIFVSALFSTIIHSHFFELGKHC